MSLFLAQNMALCAPLGFFALAAGTSAPGSVSDRTDPVALDAVTVGDEWPEASTVKATSGASQPLGTAERRARLTKGWEATSTRRAVEGPASMAVGLTTLLLSAPALADTGALADGGDHLPLRALIAGVIILVVAGFAGFLGWSFRAQRDANRIRHLEGELGRAQRINDVLQEDGRRIAAERDAARAEAQRLEGEEVAMADVLGEAELGHEPLEPRDTLSNPQRKFVIGRDHGANLSLTGAGADSVSRLHAEVVVTAEGLWIKDLGSSNGTRVTRRGETEPIVVLTDSYLPLRSGDRITVGQRMLTLQGLEAGRPVLVDGKKAYELPRLSHEQRVLAEGEIARRFTIGKNPLEGGLRVVSRHQGQGPDGRYDGTKHVPSRQVEGVVDRQGQYWVRNFATQRSDSGGRAELADMGPLPLAGTGEWVRLVPGDIINVAEKVDLRFVGPNSALHHALVAEGEEYYLEEVPPPVPAGGAVRGEPVPSKAGGLAQPRAEPGELDWEPVPPEEVERKARIRRTLMAYRSAFDQAGRLVQGPELQGSLGAARALVQRTLTEANFTPSDAELATIEAALQLADSIINPVVTAESISWELLDRYPQLQESAYRATVDALSEEIFRSWETGGRDFSSGRPSLAGLPAEEFIERGMDRLLGRLEQDRHRTVAAAIRASERGIRKDRDTSDLAGRIRAAAERAAEIGRR